MITEPVTHERRQSLREMLVIAYRAIEAAQEEFPNDGNLKRMDEIASMMEWVRHLREVTLAGEYDF